MVDKGTDMVLCRSARSGEHPGWSLLVECSKAGDVTQAHLGYRLFVPLQPPGRHMMKKTDRRQRKLKGT